MTEPDVKTHAGIACLINGARREMEPGTTIAVLLAQLGLSPPQVVIEHNGEALAREKFGIELRDGDRLEIAQMVGGG